METLVSICLGVALSAACGFRVFVPALFLSVAARTGHVTLSPGFDWMAGTPALVTFAVATVLEIGAYWIPWLDHLLDTIATPAAVVAGIVMTASVLTGLDPTLKWALALIAGGGAAGSIQALTVGARALSLGTTGGLANPIVSTLEAGGAAVLSALAVLVPILAFLLFLGTALFLASRLLRKA